MTDRGVSTMLSYALTLTVTALLISGLFVAAGGFVEDQHERAIRSELRVIGNRLAADLSAADRLAMADGDAAMALTSAAPSSTAGRPYRVNVTDTAGGATIELSTDDPAVEVTVNVKLATPVTGSIVSGGDFRITYDGTLEVDRA